jgi:hypothetical protein
MESSVPLGCLAVKEAPCAKGYLKDFEVNLHFQIKWDDLPVWSKDLVLVGGGAVIDRQGKRIC